MKLANVLLLASLSLILAGCKEGIQSNKDGFFECVKSLTSKELKEKDSILFCAMKYEENILESDVEKLLSQASLNLSTGKKYQFEPEVKSNLDKTIITRVRFTVSIKQSEETKSFDLWSEMQMIPPGSTATIQFSNLDMINLTKDFRVDEGDEWSYYITGAKGVKM